MYTAQAISLFCVDGLVSSMFSFLCSRGRLTAMYCKRRISQFYPGMFVPQAMLSLLGACNPLLR